MGFEHHTPHFPPAASPCPSFPNSLLSSTPHFPLLPSAYPSFLSLTLFYSFTQLSISLHRKQEEESLRAAIALSQAESDEQKKEEEEKEEESGDLLLDLNSSGVVDPWSVPAEPPPSYDAVTGSKAPDPWSTYPATTTQPTQPGTSLGRVRAYIISMLYVHVVLIHVKYGVSAVTCGSPV